MKIITDVKFTDDAINFRIFGQKFTKYIYFSPSMTDKIKVYIIGETLKEIGHAIQKTAVYGKPEKHPETIQDGAEYTIGFDKNGKVIIPK